MKVDIQCDNPVEVVQQMADEIPTRNNPIRINGQKVDTAVFRVLAITAAGESIEVAAYFG